MLVLERLMSPYIGVIVVVLATLQLLFLLFLLINHIALRRLTKKYNLLMQGVAQGNLEEVIQQYVQKVRNIENHMEALRATQERQGKIQEQCIQNINLVRFNAYDNMGSDLSFAAAFLDNQGDGLVLTSLYGRNDCRIFAKPVQGGESTYFLSDEEQAAIAGAIKGKKAQTTNKN